MSQTTKRFAVINKETELSSSFHATRKAAEAVAKEMTEYHHKTYVVVERKLA